MPEALHIAEVDPETAADASLVPPLRFGALLHRSRGARHDTLAAVARRSPRWLPDDLIAIERGSRELDDGDVEDLASLYQVEPEGLPRGKSMELVFDRTSASDLLPGASVEDHGADTGKIVARFLALAVLLGPLERVPLRMSAAADALGLPVADVVGQADGMARNESDAVRALAERLSQRTVVPAAGIQVGVVAGGTLIVGRRPGSRRPQSPGRAAARLGALLGDRTSTSGVGSNVLA